MKMLRLVIALALAGLGVVPSTGQAATDTALATISAVVPLVTTVDLLAKSNSVATDPGTVLFDLVDCNDVGVVNPNCGFMYAPKRSIQNKNWHVAQIAATGSTMTISASVSGTAGSQPMADVLDVFCGGFFHVNGSDKGGASTDWELADGFTRSWDEPLEGEMPFNYRLRIDQIPAGSYSGAITYTLIST